jgi:transcriptional regulator GlxA family with amidase domain
MAEHGIAVKPPQPAKNSPVRQVAHIVGYDNEASFSKAFSRLFASPPGE